VTKLHFLFLILPFSLCACISNLNTTSKPLEQEESSEISASIGSPFGLDELCYQTAHSETTSWQELDLWDRILFGYAIPKETNARIDTELKWFAKHPEYIKRVSQRGSRYWFYIVNELEKRNMPLELAFLPIVESGFDPFAYSPGRASGMWQIIPGTAKELGLKQSWWYDGRRDTTQSTHAALNYLESLNKRFNGNWLHALAAYNSGGGRVSKAIRANKKQGKPTDFWNLKLPKETAAYVPRLLALAKLFETPSAYGLKLIPLKDEAIFAEVKIDGQIDLAQAADLASISMDEFYQLNPGYNRWATDPAGPHDILIPIEAVNSFKQKLAALPHDQRLTWRRHTIKNGETLSHIAKKYSVSISALQSANDISHNRIVAGKTLLVPSSAKAKRFYSMSSEQRLSKKQNRTPSKNSNKQVHVVQPGDSFWKIAKQFGVSSGQVARWNNMSPKDPLSVGKKLVLWTDNNLPTSAKKNEVIRKLSYKVRRGDSLAKIASKFRVKIQDIARWNQINTKKYLQPGQALVLFVDVKG